LRFLPIAFITLFFQLFPVLASAETGSLFGQSNNNDSEFLPVEEAFKVEGTVEGQTLKLHWDVADGYYLYKHRFKFSVLSPETGKLGTPNILQKGKIKEDPTFGTVEAFYHEVDIEVPILAPRSGSIEVQVRYQGCADKGLCYLPQKTAMYFPLPGEASGAAKESSSALKKAETQPSSNQDTSSALGLASILDQSSLFTIIGIFFVLGLGLTFTPCVLPMIPILSGIIVGQGEAISRKKAFTLSLAYVLGMALTYAIAGVIAGKTGAKLQLYMQDPTVLFTFAGVFILLSLSMFGFYELQLPSAIQNSLNNISNKQKGGTLLGVAAMGALSALVVSPCVSAPLAGALIYIGNTGDGTLGGISLMALGLGMGTPLLIIGTTGGNILPKAGGWMDSVKGLFGVGLLAVALWLIKHLIPDAVGIIFWGLLAMIAAAYLGAFQAAETPKAQLFKGIGLTLATLCLALVLTAVANTLRPNISSSSITAQETNTAGLAFNRIRTMANLEQSLIQAKQSNQPVMIDYYADWCISCIELEHEAFQNKEVISLLSNHRLIQIDLTDNEEAEALLDRFNLQGPPSILFFDTSGDEQTSARIYAYKDEMSFLQHIRTLTSG